jgi:thiamine-monophosphate kinase
MSEFDLIRQLQKIISFEPRPGAHASVVGIGDDAAVLELPPGRQLIVTTDTLVQGVHFSPRTTPGDLGHKSLAVSLSDLASMGAEPAWFFLALTLPGIDSAWTDAFAKGMADLAENTGIELAGGDTTSGPLSITVTALGLVETGQALRRSGAREGDIIVVSGSLGGAAFALKMITAGEVPAAACAEKLHRPDPRLGLGCRLHGLATSCIDLSDGLLADLGHVLHASGKGAEIHLERLPSPECMANLNEKERLELQTGGGDDYELCFTIPRNREPELAVIQRETGIRLTAIGEITASRKLLCFARDGEVFHASRKGYEHFAGDGG